MPAVSKNFRRVTPRKTAETLRQQEIHERRVKAMSLKVAGASNVEIARANIGYSSGQLVGQDMKNILATWDYHAPEEMVTLDLARLDELQKIYTHAVRTGNLQWGSMILRIMQFRRETLGYTPETIAELRRDKNQIQNNGIMVVQGTGTASDYLIGMMQAAGATEKEARAELEKVSDSNKPSSEPIEVLEVVKPKRKSKRFKVVRKSKGDGESLAERLEDFDRTMTHSEASTQTKPLATDEQLLDIDVPAPGRDKTIQIPIKPDIANVELHTGIAYKVPPRPLSESEHARKVRQKQQKLADQQEHVNSAPDDARERVSFDDTFQSKTSMHRIE